MGDLWKNVLWQQFGATIDMLDNALSACPAAEWEAALWKDRSGLSDFWYVAYHTLFWLDLYLSGAVEGFSPPEPFDLAELDPAGLLPSRVFTREELRVYLAHCRGKCRATIENLTDEGAARLCRFAWGEIPFAGLLLDNMRHVQEHTAQLNMYLGQAAGWGSRWLERPTPYAGML